MKKISKVWSISNEEFSELVSSNTSIISIVGELGYSRTSGSMAKKVKDRITQEKLSTEHFISNNKNKKIKQTPKYSLEEILVENSKYENINRLKIRIIADKIIEYVCSGCGNKGEWNGKKLTLQLHHKNGVHNDHRIENIEFICPNCHSQTDTYSGKNIKT